MFLCEREAAACASLRIRFRPSVISGVMTGAGEYIEVQGTAEGKPFSRDFLNQQLDLAAGGIAQLTKLQRETLGSEWPFA